MQRPAALPKVPLAAGLAILAAWLALLAPRAACAQAGSAGLERAVEATYLYKFAAFVEWPQAAGAQAAFDLCVVGDDPFGAILDRAVAGQSVGGKPIVVKRFPVVAGNPGCRTMYVAGSAAQPVADALARVRGTPVLTVTGAAGAARGIINFVLVDNHVRFAIDDAAARENGLVISSKLLSLAVSVQPAVPR